MARKSLRPQLNQIRAWVREGRTDAWIAHQLDVSASELKEFRRQHDLAPGEDETGALDADLRDEIEAEIKAPAAEEEALAEETGPEEDEVEVSEDEETETDGEEAEGRPRPRRRRRRGRGRGTTAGRACCARRRAPAALRGATAAAAGRTRDR